MYIFMPALEVGMTFFNAALFGPRFRVPALLLNDDREAHQAAGTDGVVHDVLAGADPVDACIGLHALGQVLERDHAAPGDTTRELRAVLLDHGLARDRVHAIGPDQRIAFDARAVVQNHVGELVGLAHFLY